MTWRQRLRAYTPHIAIAGLLVMFVVVFFFHRIFIVIGPGDVGVMYRPLFGGTVIDHVYSEGLHVTLPWNRVYIYDTRIGETKRLLSALTKDGLSVELDLSIRYHPEISTVGILHQAVGPEYIEKIVVPEVFAVVRRAIGNRTAEELYSGTSGGGEEEQTLAQIIDNAVDKVSRKYVVVDAVVLTRVKLPAMIERAIERKVEQRQLAQTQQFREEVARREVGIKTLEAQANTVLSASLTPELLRYRGIEATKELAQSPNSKIVVIGSGTNGLPLILNTETPP
jgi:regulator of protease activity HflC (stomatin/prohibitin superfamily)